MNKTPDTQLRAISNYRERRAAEGYRTRQVLVHDDDWPKLREVAEVMRVKRTARKSPT